MSLLRGHLDVGSRALKGPILTRSYQTHRSPTVTRVDMRERQRDKVY